MKNLNHDSDNSPSGLATSEEIVCWCGNSHLEYFSDSYGRCTNCETLVWVGKDDFQPVNELEPEDGYYGRNYWFDHQVDDLDLPDIIARARKDLPERCLFWLRSLLKYRLPPSKSLELGSSHGGFVSLMQKVGYEAIGLELSPWIADFAHKTFQVPMLLGPVESQKIDPASLDIIVLLDVLEHLQSPLSTLRHCVQLLKPDGILVVQTPCFPVGKTYERLKIDHNSFVRMLIPEEHIYLFSKKGIQMLVDGLQMTNLIFEPAYFSEHDMFFIASRLPIQPSSPDEVERYLLSIPNGRFILALFDLDDQLTELGNQLSELRHTMDVVEADRAERLQAIHRLRDKLIESQQIIQDQQRILNWLPHNVIKRIYRRLTWTQRN